MKRMLIVPDLSQYPDEFHPLLANSAVYDSSCSPQARVIYIEKDGGYYLKSSPKGTLKTEAELTRYFHSKGLATDVLSYRSDEKDWILTRRVAGEDCTFEKYLENPEKLSDLTATLLRQLHETSYKNCPVQNHMDRYFTVAEANYRSGHYDTHLLPGKWGYVSPEKAWSVVQNYGHLLKNDTLLHGDYCLPNIMLKDWNFSGFVDLGNGGVGDRHVDLFWGAWTLNFNLKTDKYRERFFDAYGRDKIDLDLLRVVAAFEVFG